jgi:ParB family chromosome partitioning protein
MISGHRRKRACERLGLLSMRCELKDISRDEAIILMVDSNSQRSEIVPCDKGRAYKMKLDAMNRQGKRTDLTSAPVGQKLTREELAEQTGDSHSQIQRYIRLTQLIPELQEFVDEGRIKMRPAVELSYLDEEAQRDVVDLIDETEAFPSHDQAIRMRKAFDEGKLDYNAVDKIMKEEKPNQKPSYKLKYEDIKAYFKPGADFAVVLRDILKGLELLKKQRARENREAR